MRSKQIEERASAQSHWLSSRTAFQRISTTFTSNSKGTSTILCFFLNFCFFSLKLDQKRAGKSLFGPHARENSHTEGHQQPEDLIASFGYWRHWRGGLGDHDKRPSFEPACSPTQKEQNYKAWSGFSCKTHLREILDSPETETQHQRVLLFL